MSYRRRGSTNSNSNTTLSSSPSAYNDPPSTSERQELSNLYSYLLKTILLGPSGSGKSCLLHRFTHNTFRTLSSQTIGVEFASKIVRIGEPSTHTGGSSRRGGGYGGGGRKRVKLQLWDTAGTERFRSVSRSYYRGAAGAVLCYDLGCWRSFEGLGEFLRDARALAGEGLSVVLVGCKSDLVEERGGGSVDVGEGRARAREVPAATAAAWAQRNGIASSLEVSALTGEGVEEVFLKLARSVVTKIELGDVDPGDPLSGVQYGDADVFGLDDGSSSVRTGLTSDGFSSTRTRRRKRGILSLGNGGGRKCC